MTYAATVLIDNRPVEFYEFTSGSDVLRANNQEIDLIGPGGNNYLGLKLRRTKISKTRDLTANKITVSMPGSVAFFRGFIRIPPSTLPKLTITQQFQNDPDSEFRVRWRGSTTSFARDDNLLNISCEPLTRIFDKEVPRAVFSFQCNWLLFDSGCTLVRTTRQFMGTVTTISADGTVLTIPGLRTQAAAIDATVFNQLTTAELDTYWQGGYIETPLAAETRGIYEGDVDSDPDKVRVSVPFQDLAVGTQLTVFAGCANDPRACQVKHNNFLNYGGFHLVPGSPNNPFTKQLDGGPGPAAGGGGGNSRLASSS